MQHAGYALNLEIKGITNRSSDLRTDQWTFVFQFFVPFISINSDFLTVYNILRQKSDKT